MEVAVEDIEFELGKYRVVQEPLCASPDIFFTLPFINGTELKLHFFLDDRAECQSGIIEWAEDDESEFTWLCEDTEREERFGIDYAEIDDLIERLRPFADEVLTETLLGSKP
jgi:hypothetical protein